MKYNSGSIIANDNTNIMGNNIHNNGGLILGNSTTIVANTDVVNTSGTILDDSFNKAIKNLPKFRKFNKNNPEDLRDAGKNLDGYDDSKKEVYYEVKDDDGYALRREYKTKSNENRDFTPSQVNAGLGSNTDIATTNIYNYMVEPIKTIDIKTEDDREKDREYYINSQE